MKPKDLHEQITVIKYSLLEKEIKPMTVEQVLEMNPQQGYESERMHIPYQFFFDTDVSNELRQINEASRLLGVFSHDKLSTLNHFEFDSFGKPHIYVNFSKNLIHYNEPFTDFNEAFAIEHVERSKKLKDTFKLFPDFKSYYDEYKSGQETPSDLPIIGLQFFTALVPYTPEIVQEHRYFKDFDLQQVVNRRPQPSMGTIGFKQRVKNYFRRS